MAERTTARIITFGAEQQADVRIGDVRLDELDRPAFAVVTPSGRREVHLGLHGRHQSLNAAAALAAGIAADVPVDVAVAALEQVTTISPHRMQLRHREDGLIVIDDAYNANPDSTRAALSALARIRGAARGRTWAVLGPMRELGAESDSLHASVGAAAAELAVDELVVVGDDADAIADGARSTAGWTGTVHRVADAAAASALLREQAAGGDIVLVKASNSERLWRVADALLTDVRATA
jgi:UDP-N-acetylmuramoyl-tripeptide--D-alanyl-D-alanine ligase